MPWINKISTPQEIADEVKLNLEDKTDNARLLILGTETPKGYTMRMTLKNREAVAGVIYSHAVKTGELNEALAMCDALIRIGMVAKDLIQKEVLKRKQNN